MGPAAERTVSNRRLPWNLLACGTSVARSTFGLKSSALVKPSESVRITSESRPGGTGLVGERPGLSGGVAACVAAPDHDRRS